MSISRVIEVSFGGGSIAYAKVDTAYFYNNGILFKPTDIDLPASYQVHWAYSPQASSTLETIGTAEGAPIPDDLWNRSRVIYGWIYLHPTEDSGVTGYEVRIYKNVRAGMPDGTEPTPAEQSTIDQLIGALNTAVEQAEDAQEAIENMSVSATTLTEGASATVTKSEQDGVVHLAFGIPKGATGDGGYSPTANVSKSGKTATITITDKNGTTSAQVSDGTDGTDGEDGISPAVSVTDITGGHRVVITDKDGAKSFDVEDGATGATPNLTIGTVETLEPTDDATATITGTAENPVLNLGIPRGQTGEVTEEEFTQLKSDLSEVESDIYSSEIVRKYDTSISYDGNVTLTSGNTYIRLIPTVVKRGYIELYSYKPTQTPYRAYVLDINYKVKKIVSCKTAVATRIRIDGDGYIAIGGNTNSWWLAQFTISDVGDTTYESTSFQFATPNGSENVTVGTSLGTPVEVGQKGAYLVRITQYETYFDRSTPVVITVGTGKDYTDLKEAVDYANTLSGERIVEVYEGVYDVYANITQDEINDAQYEGSASHFVGLRISDGMTLRGIGDKRNIIINGALSTSYSQDVRNAISTLNLLGNCTMENVTVTSDGIRYPVHDDYRANANAVHKVKDCIFRSISGVYGAIPNSYGLGGRSGLKLEIDSCEFFPSAGYHTNNGFELPCCVKFKNCTIDGQLVLDDYTSSVVNSVELINTTCVSISFSAQSGNTKQSIAIVVRGKSIPIINNTSYDVVYDSSDVLKGRAYDALTKGAPARIRNNYQIQKFNADTSPMLYQGVVLKDVAYTDIAMIQCHGWIETSFFPSLTLAVGDKIGVVNGVFAIVQSDEVGVVKRDGLVWLY